MPIDLFVIAGILVFAFLIIIYAGKSTGVAAIIALYPALLIFNFFPYLAEVASFGRNEFEQNALGVGVFTLIALLCYITIRKAVSVVFSWTPVVKLFEAVILSFVLTGLLVLSYVSVAGISMYITTAPLPVIFTGSQAIFWWLSGGILSFLLVLRR